MGRQTSQYCISISMVNSIFYMVNSTFYMVNLTFIWSTRLFICSTIESVFICNSIFYMVNLTFYVVNLTFYMLNYRVFICSTGLFICSTFAFVIRATNALRPNSNKDGCHQKRCLRLLTRNMPGNPTRKRNECGLFLFFDNFKLLLSTIASFEQAERFNRLSLEDI